MVGSPESCNRCENFRCKPHKFGREGTVVNDDSDEHGSTFVTSVPIEDCDGGDLRIAQIHHYPRTALQILNALKLKIAQESSKPTNT